MINLVPLISLVAVLPNPDSCTAAVPLRAGWAWSYAGSALWSGCDEIRTDSGAVAWTMMIVGARDAGSARIALVRGVVSQLAFYEPTMSPRLSLLACRGSRLFALELASDSAAQRAYAEWSDSLLQEAQLLLELPLHDGQLFGQDPPRADPLYGGPSLRCSPGLLPPVVDKAQGRDLSSATALSRIMPSLSGSLAWALRATPTAITERRRRRRSGSQHAGRPAS